MGQRKGKSPADGKKSQRSEPLHLRGLERNVV